jgi:ABC-type transporter Mla subunit MlaD
MERKRFFLGLFLLVLWVLASGCASSLRMTVLYDQTRGLKPGDRVFCKGQNIGPVERIEVDPQGRYRVHLQIKQDFRNMVTEQSRFLIQGDPLSPGNRAVEMVQLAPGGRPLADGATVEGSSSISVLLEEGTRGLQSWSKLFQEVLEGWQKEVSQLPEKAWFKNLEQQMENWTRVLEESGEEMHRYFREEVLPRLEESMRELDRRLQELGEKDIKDLEKKLEQMKNL